MTSVTIVIARKFGERTGESNEVRRRENLANPLFRFYV